MVGVGLGLLFSRRRSGNTHRMSAGRSYRRWDYDDEYPSARREQFLHETERGMSGRIGPMQERAGGVIDDAKDTINDTKDTISGRVSDMASNAGDLASGAGDRAAHLATTAGSTAVGAGESFWGMVQRNPVPAAITGLGLAWMWMNRNETRFRPLETVSNVMPSMPPVGDLTDRAKGQIGGLGSEAQTKAQRAQNQFGCMLQDTPLAIGAAALGLGAAIGLAVPTTSRERELMGEARETLMEKTQQVAQDAQQRLRSVAEQVKETTREELKNSDTNEFGSQQPQSASGQGQPGSTQTPDRSPSNLRQGERGGQHPESRAS
jgi:hypothetical protein